MTSRLMDWPFCSHFIKVMHDELKISGISLVLGFDFYWCELTEGLEHEKKLNMSSTTYHNTLEWYNKQLFNNEDGKDLEVGDKEVDKEVDKEEDLNAAYCRMRQQQWDCLPVNLSSVFHQP